MNNFDPVYNNSKKIDLALCAKCKCTWFEQLQVRQFKADHTAILGQTVPQATEFQFVIFRCINCLEKYQPNVLITQQDREAKQYNEMLDFFDKKETEVAKEPDKEIKP